jgi:hypothetical protein
MLALLCVIVFALCLVYWAISAYIGRVILPITDKSLVYKPATLNTFRFHTADTNKCVGCEDCVYRYLEPHENPCEDCAVDKCYCEPQKEFEA